METQKPKKDPYAALRIKDFSLYISSRFLMTVAMQMQTVIIGWQIYELTNDPLSLGLIGLAEAIPTISISLYAGHLADKISRKKIMMNCLAAYLLCACALLFMSTQYVRMDVLKGDMSLVVTAMYGIIFISGIAQGFAGPAFGAFRAQLVPRELYGNASAWSSASWQTGAVLGPAIGGLLFGFKGAIPTYSTIVALLLIGSLAVVFIAPKPIPQMKEGETIWERLTGGVRFVFKNQELVGALTLDLFAVLFGGAVALLPVFAKDILHVGAEGLGMLRAAPSVGAVTMALFLAFRPPLDNAGRNLLWAVGGFGVCMIVFGLSKNFYLSLAVLALSGALDSVSVVIRQTITQMLTPVDMMGRVSSVNTIFVGSSNEIGAFESGVAAKLLGTVPSVVFGGIMTLVVVGVVAASAPKIRNLHLSKLH
ncbi:MAG TPA: MFS transporter [Patescibacteria group bacterium]|nr:MFS transporter [Patescibacteria group bacterium]